MKISVFILVNRSCKCCTLCRIDLSGGTDPAETVKNVLSNIIGFLIMSLSLKILCVIHDLMMLCLNIGDIDIVPVKNLEQFICQKILCLKIVGIYKMHVKDINTKNRVYNYSCQTYELV